MEVRRCSLVKTNIFSLVPRFPTALRLALGARKRRNASIQKTLEEKDSTKQSLDLFSNTEEARNTILVG